MYWSVVIREEWLALNAEVYAGAEWAVDNSNLNEFEILHYMYISEIVEFHLIISKIFCKWVPHIV